MATIATMVVLKPQSMSISSPKIPSSKPVRRRSISLPSHHISTPSSLATTTIAGAIFSSLSYSDAAFAAQQIADLAEGDNRGLALLIPIVPAIGWVLYNILQPALNQLNRMSSERGVVIGLGLGGGLALAGLMSAPSASASEIAMMAEATSQDNRGLLLLFVVAPAIAWVLYNILQPALNQLNRMRSG